MSANFYELLKYAATGIASPDMTYYDRMRASTLMGGKKKVHYGFKIDKSNDNSEDAVIYTHDAVTMTPPYNFTGTDFVTLSNAEVPTGNGYLSKVQSSEYGSVPASIANGSSTKYFKDYFYTTATDTRVALRGGDCLSDGRAGFRSVLVNRAASGSAWSIGASPVYK